VDHEFLKNVTLQEIKNQILERLGFNNDHQPNASSMRKDVGLPPVALLANFHHQPFHIRHEKIGGPFVIEEGIRFDDGDERVKTHTVVAKAKEGESGT
jgi:hypothetical protein